MRLLNVVGARPNFMKIAPIIRALREHNAAAGSAPIESLLVHTGQHYDERMSRQFFTNLGIPEPDINLEVGSGSHAAQTAEILKRFEPICLEYRPTHVLVVGDVNSTVACALAAAKLGIRVIHVEAGLRSGDRSMPEEINRVLTDAISDLLFTSEESANENLRREGIPAEKIHFVGNVMIDTLLHERRRAGETEILHRLELADGDGAQPAARPYALLTLHRPSNVDDPRLLAGILEAVEEVSRLLPVIFPVHPRTADRLRRLVPDGVPGGVRGGAEPRRPGPAPPTGTVIVQPLGYLEFLNLMANARLVLTDSGGVQEETTILGVPCVTLRENTERPVTVTLGTNLLAGVRRESIIACALRQLEQGRSNDSRPAPPLWDGGAARRIVRVLREEQKKEHVP